MQAFRLLDLLEVQLNHQVQLLYIKQFINKRDRIVLSKLQHQLKAAQIKDQLYIILHGNI